VGYQEKITKSKRAKMTKIRVTPSLLLEAANELQRISSEVEAVGGQVQTAASRAPSYEGQFGPEVKSLGSEAIASSRKLAQNLSALAEELLGKGMNFEAADLAGVEGLAGILAKFEAWLSSDRLLALDEFPLGYVTRLLLLGTLLNTGSGGSPDEEPDWEPPKWAPLAIGAANFFWGFDKHIGKPIRRFFLTEEEIEPSLDDFVDPSANENLVIEGQMTFGSPPYSLDPGYPGDPDVPMEGLHAVLTIIRQAGKLSLSHANADYLSRLEANVTINLHYSVYEEGLRIAGLQVENNSEVPLKVYRTDIVDWTHNDAVDLLLPKGVGQLASQTIIQPGETKLVSLQTDDPELTSGVFTTVSVYAVSIDANPQYARIGWRIGRDGQGVPLSPGW
jgi:hypothetical protein